MPSRRLMVEGHAWRVYPGGFLTQYAADEFSLIFVRGAGNAREVRFVRFSPKASRSREQALAEFTDAELARLFDMSQSSARAPEAGYRT